MNVLRVIDEPEIPLLQWLVKQVQLSRGCEEIEVHWQEAMVVTIMLESRRKHPLS